MLKRSIWTILIPALLAACGGAPTDEASSEQTESIAQPVVVPSTFKGITQQYENLNFGLPSPWEPISGDFDGDGVLDYARVGSTGAWMYYGNGDGTFEQGFHDFGGLDFHFGSEWQTVTGDFDGDGCTDFARLGDKDAFIFFNNSDRTFFQGYYEFKWGDQGQYDLHFGFHSPWTTITGDFNGDGLADFARVGDTGAWVYTGHKEAYHGGFIQTFQAYSGLNFGLPSTYKTITGDFNGDGKTDYARLGPTGAFFFMGNSKNSFDPGGFLDYSSSAWPGAPTSWDVIVGDFDGDHRDDFARLGDKQAEFFYSKKDQFVRRIQNYAGQSFAPSLWQTIVGDFNGDGITDYARLGSSGGFFFYGAPNQAIGGGYESYPPGQQIFGSPSSWQALVGKFNSGDSNADYIRLGDVKSVLFVRKPSVPLALHFDESFWGYLVYRWYPVSDAESLLIREYKNGSLYNEETLDGTATRETEFGYDTTPGTKYCFQLQARNSAVESDWTNLACHTVTGPPPLPVGDQLTSIWMERQQIWEGPIPYVGSFGPINEGTITITKVNFPTQFPAVLLVKPGHSTTECGDPNAVVLVSGDMTDEQKQAIWGTSNLTLGPGTSLNFVGCSTSNQILDLLPVNLTWHFQTGSAH